MATCHVEGIKWDRQHFVGCWVRLSVVPAQVLFDTGSQGNFLSSKFVEHSGLKKRLMGSRGTYVATSANGSSVTISGEVHRHLTIQGHTSK